MEDRHCVCEAANSLCLGVMDGHRSVDAAEWLSKELPAALLSACNGKCGGAETKEVISNVFVATDQKLREQSPLGGSTANLCLADASTFCFCNVGDSRSYFVQRSATAIPAQSLTEHLDEMVQRKKNSAVYQLTFPLDKDAASEIVLDSSINIVPTSTDHKPTVPTETKRIEMVGGTVVNGRVNGKLGTSRAFGDFDLKPNQNAALNPLSCIPDIVCLPREKLSSPSYYMIVIGCDGVWEVLDIKTIVGEVTRVVDVFVNLSQHVTRTVDGLEIISCESEVGNLLQVLLQKACPSAVDQRGSSPGSDNMTLGVAVIFV